MALTAVSSSNASSLSYFARSDSSCCIFSLLSLSSAYIFRAATKLSINQSITIVSRKQQKLLDSICKFRYYIYQQKCIDKQLNFYEIRRILSTSGAKQTNTHIRRLAISQQFQLTKNFRMKTMEIVNIPLNLDGIRRFTFCLEICCCTIDIVDPVRITVQFSLYELQNQKYPLMQISDMFH